ncbi:enolase-phosphatase E1-like protein [Leptotrombidium deliense]|uniref:Enolase-phosphatase E1-like protein n=1 Tax=Leptotrombidium deliense TaxID=299467 RepID=A0A443SSD4_9ACAR|nr:enolase-phosphatase E1-like protein [Leptotrombidium deliense]
MTDNDEPKMKAWLPTAVIVGFYGTITSVKWEDEVVIPFIKNNLRSFIDAHWSDMRLADILSNLRSESLDHRFRFEHDDCPIVSGDEDGEQNVKKSMVDYLIWQINKKNESESNYAIQRDIRQEAMAKGALKTHLFEDVKPAFDMWSKNMNIYLYTSIGIEDLKFLLQHTTVGDLTPTIKGYFSQKESNAAKMVANSLPDFIKYATSINLNKTPAKVLIVTSFGKEAKASADAGMESILVKRTGNTKIRDYYEARFDSVDSFLDIQFVPRRS